MKSYDVGIFGWWYNYNYGATLTYYALNTAVKGLGYTTIMLCRSNLKDNDRVSLQFAKRYYDISPIVKKEELNSYNNFCRAFLLGSDQMWNPSLERYTGEQFFLSFANDEKIKVAYAQSFGNYSRLPSKFVEKYKKYIDRFDAISVRENYGKQACKNSFNIDVPQVCDPVFLIDVNDYKKISKKADINFSGNYLLCFLLDPSIEKITICNHVKENMGFDKIVYLTDMGNADDKAKIINSQDVFPNISIEGFLNAYENASYVITDSFHGTCMATIFQKDFISLANTKRGTKRFSSLMEWLGLENRLFFEYEKLKHEIPSKIDYSNVNTIIEKSRKEGLKWLDNNLSKIHNVHEPCFEKLHFSAIDNASDSDICKTSIETVNKNMCTGCSACINICPKKALSFGTDQYGYYVPVIDVNKCIECGLCRQICPALHLPENNNARKPNLYKFIAKDESLLVKSSSGGAFSLLAESILKQGGVVVGCAWRDDFTVGHVMVENYEELYKLRKSKYMQSFMGDVFTETKKRLESGQKVLFTACPCQIAGLKAYLQKEYDDLYVIDLLCGNAPSAEFFKSYLNEQFPEGIKSYEFRNKTHGVWYSYTIQLTENDNAIHSISSKDDPYMKAYHPHVMIPEHCEKCKYQSLPRYGDLTIGDFWGISKHEYNEKIALGVSAVLCNNDKGRKLLNLIPQEEVSAIEEKPLAWLGGNGSALKGRHNWASPNRDMFYRVIKEMSFSQAVLFASQSLLMSENPVEKKSLMPLHFDSSGLHFIFDPEQWEEHYILRKTVLIPKKMIPKPGHFAMLPLLCMLNKGQRYQFIIRFKLSSNAKRLNFHIMNSVAKKSQIIYRHIVDQDDFDKWQIVNTTFVANSDCFDVFSIGASQVSGESRKFVIDYVTITNA